MDEETREVLKQGPTIKKNTQRPLYFFKMQEREVLKQSPTIKKNAQRPLYFFKMQEREIILFW